MALLFCYRFVLPSYVYQFVFVLFILFHLWTSTNCNSIVRWMIRAVSTNLPLAW
jgi:hypothetical protein